ncbi:glycosyltransferase [Rivularia sp. UHCC 0363]|uniref:glycosyltransferase n=1 Tax=Rivularia sp. UHCC 0363 TaxID=3110244 RepID=UPI002B1F7E48|nr:glycosyltransferase [Rivularia sp. UHCC 0363]MEA5598357.1 glycosyltransferase [Rivularia sp. UHCC 0363]
MNSDSRLLVSIIINNYNYEGFLPEAIDSAINQSYQNTEVIVVDDCSTDNSRHIIASYGDKILPIYHQENGKQAAAFNSGFAISKGEIIIFLDADDYLFPNAVEKIVSVWKPNLAKVHYRLQVVDSNRQSLGFSYPQGGKSLSSGEVWRTILEVGGYAGVATSGNAINRKALKEVFPISEEYKLTADDYLSMLIPFYGEVVAIEEPLAAYRIHTSNQWALATVTAERFHRFVRHDLQNYQLLVQKADELDYQLPKDFEQRSIGRLWSRMASLRLDPQHHPIPSDKALPLIYMGIRSLWKYSDHNWLKKLIFSMWFLWVGLLPLPLAKMGIIWLFIPHKRPKPIDWVRQMLHKKDTLKEINTNSSALRVLFVSHTYVVGVNQGKLNAVATTDEAKVALLVPKQWNAKQWNKQLKLEKPYEQIKYYPAQMYFSGQVGACIYSPLALLRAIINFRPDIIQVEQEAFSLSALQLSLCARFFNKPVVFFGWENMDRQLSPFRRWIRRYVFNTAKLMIAGNCEGGELVKKWGYSGTVEVMPQMGVDTKLFSPVKNKESNSEFLIGFVGRLSYQKGIDTLIAAAHLLNKQGKNFRVILCGSGSDEPIFRQEAQKHNVNELITWRGGVRHDEVPQEMQKFDVLVLPSRTVETWKEQFGHVIIEAMATGIPVVGSTCGEIPNVIGRSDLVFAEGNAQELAAILARLISDNAWYSEVLQYSLNRVHKHYSHERIAQRLIDLWQNILKQKGESAYLHSSKSTSNPQIASFDSK